MKVEKPSSRVASKTKEHADPQTRLTEPQVVAWPTKQESQEIIETFVHQHEVQRMRKMDILMYRMMLTGHSPFR
jgi:hypothetical protein